MKQINEAIDTIERLMKPHIVVLTAKERMGMPKVGARSYAFVQEAITCEAISPECVPAYIDMDEARDLYDRLDTMRKLMMRLNPLIASMDDTTMKYSSEVMKTALAIYQTAKEAAKRGISGAEPLYDNMRSRFKKTRRKQAVVKE